MAFAFDTLGYAKKLRDAGLPQAQAEAHAEAAREFIMTELVTRYDLETAIAATRGSSNRGSRSIVYLSLNRCDNAIRRFKRPNWIANRDFTPIAMLPDDCLLEFAREHPAAAE